MITKGIIEAVLSPYEVKVRIPTLDSVRASSLSTSTENLKITKFKKKFQKPMEQEEMLLPCGHFWQQ